MKNNRRPANARPEPAVEAATTECALVEIDAAIRAFEQHGACDERAQEVIAGLCRATRKHLALFARLAPAAVAAQAQNGELLLIEHFDAPWRMQPGFSYWGAQEMADVFNIALGRAPASALAE